MWILIHYATSDMTPHEVFGPFQTKEAAEERIKVIAKELSLDDSDFAFDDGEVEVLELTP